MVVMVRAKRRGCGGLMRSSAAAPQLRRTPRGGVVVSRGSGGARRAARSAAHGSGRWRVPVVVAERR
jgi:hypothetical protein